MHFAISANDRAALNFFGYQLATAPREAKLTTSDLTAGAEFGSGTAISGNTAVVGNPNSPGPLGNNSAGAAYVFVRSSDGAWVQQAKLIPNAATPAARFSYSVGISGDTIVVGAFTDSIGANTIQGSAFVFVKRLNLDPTSQAGCKRRSGG